MRTRKAKFKRVLMCTAVVLAAFGNFAGQSPLPHLRKQGSATQLIVDGKPFLIRGGELGNSTASNAEYMQPVWEKLVRLNMNTVLFPVYWELIEPVEGRFDFTLVDTLIRDARRNNLKIVPLWFGVWKNSMSTYVPAWVKNDQRRFPRSQGRDGRGIEILSAFSEEVLNADIKAFRALMRHIREIDSRENTVVMVQIENEIGMIPDSRDRSAVANRLYAGQVPSELMAYFEENRESLTEMRAVWAANGSRTRGAWEEIFGKGIGTEEIFTAWHFARFTEQLTKAGKAEYALPMFVNAALIRPGHVPGQYPSGGPLPHLFDVWRAGAPSVDFFAPDIYFQNFAEWARRYDRQGNPFFIPEAGTFPNVPVNILYAVGQHNAIGVSPFAIESLQEPLARQLAAAYDLLAQLEPLILANQGRGHIAGLMSEGPEQRAPQRLTMNGYAFNITYERATGMAEVPIPLSGGLIIATGSDEFIIAGTGMTITIEVASAGPQTVGLLAVDEGKFVGGKWVPGRRLNGDQTHQGRHVRINTGKFEIQRVKLYRYN